jgi:hypothetical protein
VYGLTLSSSTNGVPALTGIRASPPGLRGILKHWEARDLRLAMWREVRVGGHELLVQGRLDHRNVFLHGVADAAIWTADQHAERVVVQKRGMRPAGEQ